MSKRLIEFVELGGYPDLSPIYKELGYEVETPYTARKAVSAIKKRKPDVIVGEFNYQSEFRDRISNLESVTAAVAHMSDVRIIVLYQPEEQAIFETFKQRFPAIEAVAQPIDIETMRSILQ
ncbi:MAG: hypothetical protein OQK78_08810 [Gammaproteobacteria bacterium]|nr:hypothetical protein [Gammaproteobacteria bacterium]